MITSLVADPYAYKTYFDPSKIVNRKKSAVTLFAATGTDYFHSQLLVETVNQSGKYWKVIAHLVGGGTQPGRWEIRHRTQGSLCSASGFAKIGKVKYCEGKFSSYSVPIKYSGHSQTWVKDADKVQAMLDKIKEESDNPLQNPVPFKILGSKSSLTHPIKVYSIGKPLMKVYKARPALMKKVFDLSEKYKPTLSYKPRYEFKKGYYWEGFERDNLYQLNEDASIWKYGCYRVAFRRRSSGLVGTFKSGVNSFKNSKAYEELVRTTFKVAKYDPNLLTKEGYRYYLNYLKSGDGYYNINKNGMIKALYSNIHKKFSVKVVTPNSCITWSLEKLAMIDVHPNSPSNGLFITNTRDYIISSKK